MKRVNLMNSPRKTGLLAGVMVVLLVTCGAVWAAKDNGKIEVKTGSSSTVQSSPAIAPDSSAAQAPDYLDPVREIIRMQRDLDRFFGQPYASVGVMPSLDEDLVSGFAQPDMDLTEKADAYYVQMDLPGMDKSGITVEVKDNILTVKAEQKQETIKKDDGKVLMQERSSGFMSRAVMLAKPVDASKVAAEYQDGVLNITLPKVQADQPPKKVEIK